jgi:hypothetical protein
VDEQSVLADAFDATRTPENFLFDKESKLVYHGATDDNPSDPGHVKRLHLKEAIDEMIAGKEITIVLTTPGNTVVLPGRVCKLWPRSLRSKVGWNC